MSHLTVICLILKLKKYCIQKVPLLYSSMFKILLGKDFVKALQVTKKLYWVYRKSGWFWPWTQQARLSPVCTNFIIHKNFAATWKCTRMHLLWPKLANWYNKYVHSGLYLPEKWTFQQFSVFTINFVSWWFRSIKSIKKQNKKIQNLSISLRAGKYPIKTSIMLKRYTIGIIISIRINW